MANFTSLKRNCPVCNGLRKDCRQNNKNNLIHCRDLDVNPIDWVYRGQDALGFGMWAFKRDAEEYNSEQWQEKKREWKEQKAKREREEREKRSQSLTPIERDKEIRKILDQLYLSEYHRDLLKKRGLTDAEIKTGNYVSLKKWQKLENFVSPSLAGVKSGGYSLLNHDSGILCPIRDINGYFVAFQIRLDQEDGGRYRWGKSGDEITSHLLNGELPLSVFNPSQNGTIRLTEGTSFKPYITSLRFGCTTIGASGGNFASSSETLREYLGYLNPTQIIIDPDGGSIQNENVLKSYKKTHKLLIDWGYDPNIIKFSWWEQFNKEDGDIDEISEETREKIEYITFQEFLSKKTEYKQNRLNTIIREAELIINSQYLETDLLDRIPKQGLVIFNSYKGSRKTRITKAFIDLIRIIFPDRQVISLVPRTLLGEAQITMGLTYFSPKNRKDVTKCKNISITYDSVARLSDVDWTSAIVVIDELRQGLGHLYASDTMDDRRAYVLKFLAEKLKNVTETGGVIIGADANITELEICQMERLSGCKAFLINNTFIPKKGKVNLLKGYKDTAITEVRTRYLAGENLIIYCEHKTDSEAIKKYIEDLDKDTCIVLVNGDTSENKEIREFIRNINREIRDKKPHVLIYTSSMNTGISIDGFINGIQDNDVFNHFDYGFGFCYGDVSEPVDTCQGLVRNRRSIDFTITVVGTNNKDDRLCDPNQIKKDIIFKDRNALKLLGINTDEFETFGDIWDEVNRRTDPKTKAIDDPHFDYYCDITARRNYNQKHFYEQLKALLISEGYEIVGEEKSIKNGEGEKLTTLKKEYQLEQATNISNAKDIPLEEAKEISRSEATREERDQATKAFLKQELPEVELTPEFILKAVIKDRRKWLNAVKLFWYYYNEDILITKEKSKLMDKLYQFSLGHIYLPDYKPMIQKVDLIKKLRILELIDLDQPDKKYSRESSEIQEIFKLCLRRRSQLFSIFGITVTSKSDPITLVKKMLSLVGLDLSYSGIEREGDHRIRYYKLSSEMLNDEDRIQVLQALDRKKEMKKISEVKIPETHIQQVVEVDQHLEKEVILTESADPLPQPQNQIDVTDLNGLINRVNWLETLVDYLRIRESLIPVLDLICERLFPSMQRRLIYWEGLLCA